MLGPNVAHLSEKHPPVRSVLPGVGSWCRSQPAASLETGLSHCPALCQAAKGLGFNFRERRSLPGRDALPAEGWGGARGSIDMLEEQNWAN